MFKELEMANISLTIEQREEYLGIWAKQPYFSILQLVLGLTDRSRLQGCMYVLSPAGSEVRRLQLLMGGEGGLTMGTTSNCSEKRYQRSSRYRPL
jgi:hypothetical protein